MFTRIGAGIHIDKPRTFRPLSVFAQEVWGRTGKIYGDFEVENQRIPVFHRRQESVFAPLYLHRDARKRVRDALELRLGVEQAEVIRGWS